MNIDFLVNAVSLAGGLLLDSFNERNKNLALGIENNYLEEKALRELVVQEDLLSEKLITKKIKEQSPDARIYSEECNHLSELPGDTTSLKYIIDPLDGTHNFHFGLPYWGISVGVLDVENCAIGGVIYIPAFGIMLKNEGVDCPTQLLLDNEWQNSSTLGKSIDRSLICYDNQFYKMGHQAMKIYENLACKAFTTRITGSAVTDAAFIATGRINARIFNKTNSYDVAAGIAIVKSAGGKVTDFCGKAINVLAEQVVMSSDEVLHDSIVDIISNKNKEG